MGEAIKGNKFYKTALPFRTGAMLMTFAYFLRNEKSVKSVCELFNVIALLKVIDRARELDSTGFKEATNDAQVVVEEVFAVVNQDIHTDVKRAFEEIQKNAVSKSDIISSVHPREEKEKIVLKALHCALLWYTTAVSASAERDSLDPEDYVGNVGKIVKADPTQIDSSTAASLERTCKR